MESSQIEEEIREATDKVLNVLSATGGGCPVAMAARDWVSRVGAAISEVSTKWAKTATKGGDLVVLHKSSHSGRTSRVNQRTIRKAVEENQSSEE